MSNRFWLTSDSRQRRLFAERTTSLRRRIKLKLALSFFAWLLLVLAMSLTGCASQPPTPCEPPVLPKPPALSEPLPSVNYSEQWRALAESLRKRLTDTPTTSKN